MKIAVVVLFVGDMPADFGGISEDSERKLLYVALTRPEEYVAIIGTGHSSFLERIEFSGNVEIAL